VAIDLSGLERAAAGAGLPGLTARTERFDRRRAGWFRWTEDELVVNELVVERLSPEDGAALLVHAIVEARHLARWRRRMLVLALTLTTTFVFFVLFYSALSPMRVAFVLLLWFALIVPARRSASLQAADDEAVEQLGDPDRLVHALNAVHKDELHLGGRTINARPDIHTRAERLVKIHQLRLPSELRAGCDAPRGDG
jgi:hypothetical protein